VTLYDVLDFPLIYKAAQATGPTRTITRAHLARGAFRKRDGSNRFFILRKRFSKRA
jgi:hypothetical protein